MHVWLVNIVNFCSVKHLILADPWGFPQKPDEHSPNYKYSLFIRAAAYILQPFNPLSTVRAAGPLGIKIFV